MAIFLPRRWNRQPPYNAGVDWNNPLTRGLLLALADGNVDSVRQGVVALAGTGARQATDKGMSLRGTGNAGGSIALDLSSTGQITVSGWVFLDANTDVYRLLCEFTPDTNTNAGGFFIALTHTGAGNGQIVVNGTSLPRHNVTFPKAATGWTYVTVRINIAASPNPTVRVAYNNVSQTVTVVAAGTSRSTFANNTLFLLSRNNSSLHLTGRVLALTVHNREIADWEIRSLYFNPWQLFRPAANQTFYSLPAAAGTAYSLSLDAASYSLTGRNVDLTSARSLGLDAGAYTLTGRDVTLVYSAGTVSYTLSLDAGSYSLTGRDVGTSFGRSLALDSGAYNLSGQPITFNVTLNMLLDSGAYGLTGRVVGLTWSGETPVEITDRIVTLRSLTERWRM